MPDKKDDEGLDVWDIALPLGGAALGGVLGKRLGRKLLRYKGKMVDRARSEGMSEADIQKTGGSTWRIATEGDAVDRVGSASGKTVKQLEKDIAELRRAEAEGKRYGRTGIGRGALTAGGAAIGYKTGSDANRKRRK